MHEKIPQWLDIAIDAAKQSGEILRKGVGLRKVNMQDAKDVKLQADLESEKLIRKLLSEQTDLPIIGEEEGGDTELPNKDEYYWVVDPLDGTFNYLRDMPQTCVSIGMLKGLSPVLGVIYDFNSDTLYSAHDGAPMSINGEIITPQWAQSIDLAVLCTGFPVARDFSTDSLNDFITSIQSYKKIRMIGSAALALAFVASGKCDAYTEETIRLWDIAAGLALAKSAGAHVSVETSKSSNKPLAYDVWVVAKQEWLG